MKVVVSICYFAHNSKLGGYVLVLGTSLPCEILSDDSLPILEIVKNKSQELLGFDRNWPVFYKNIGVYEDKVDQKILHIIYATYFEDLIDPKRGATWKNILEINGLDEVSQSIIRLSAIHRN